MSTRSVQCPRCDRKTRISPSEDETEAICLACGEPLREVLLAQADELPVADEADDLEEHRARQEQIPRTSRTSRSRRPAKRVKKKGAPLWAWSIFFFGVGSLSGAGLIGGIWYQQAQESNKQIQKEVAVIAANKPKPEVIVQANTVPQLNAVPQLNEVNPGLLPGNKPQNDPFVAPNGFFKQKPQTKTETGWPLYVVSEEGFELALPPHWAQVDYKADGFDEMLKHNPQLKGLLGNFKQTINSQIKFYAVDENSIKTGSITNLNVIRFPCARWDDLDSILKQSFEELEKLPNIAKPIEHERVEAKSGNYERVRYKLAMQSPFGQKVDVTVMQMVLVKDGTVVVLSMGCRADLESNYQETFEKIEQSFKLRKLQVID